MSDLAIAVCSYKRQDLVRQYLPGIMQRARGVPVFLIDNGNSSMVREVAWSVAPDVEVLVPRGVEKSAAARNYALEHIDAAALIIMDDDIEAIGDFVPGIVDAISAGAFAGNALMTDNWLTCGPHTEVPQPYVETAWCAATRETFKALGSFPLEYRHWFVDVEMSVRAIKANIPLAAPDVPLIHRNGLTTRKVCGWTDKDVLADREIYWRFMGWAQ